MIVGTEWLVEATGCDKAALRDEEVVRAVFSRAMADLGLKAVGSVWRKFDGEGGVTGLILLTESHLACHTYPEHQTATFNLYCCRSRPEWDWEANLKALLKASDVTVSKIERGENAARNSKSDFQGEVEAETLEFKYSTENYTSESKITKEQIISEISDLGSQIAGGKL